MTGSCYKLTMALGSCTKTTRENGFIFLMRALNHPRESYKLDFVKFWKGLYIFYWHSEVALSRVNIIDLISAQNLVSTAIEKKVFIQSFSELICREWFRIDKLRLEKFMLLVRKLIRYMIIDLSRKNWSTKAISSNLMIIMEDPHRRIRKAKTIIDWNDCYLNHIRNVLLTEIIANSRLRMEQMPNVPLLNIFKPCTLIISNKINLTNEKDFKGEIITKIQSVLTSLSNDDINPFKPHSIRLLYPALGSKYKSTDNNMFDACKKQQIFQRHYLTNTEIRSITVSPIFSNKRVLFKALIKHKIF